MIEMFFDSLASRDWLIAIASHQYHPAVWDPSFDLQKEASEEIAVLKRCINALKGGSSSEIGELLALGRATRSTWVRQVIVQTFRAYAIAALCSGAQSESGCEDKDFADLLNGVELADWTVVLRSAESLLMSRKKSVGGVGYQCSFCGAVASDGAKWVSSPMALMCFACVEHAAEIVSEDSEQ